MHHHVVRSAVVLYRGGTLTLDEAANHAGVSSARMATILRRHGVTPGPGRTAGPRPLDPSSGGIDRAVDAD